MPGDVATPSDAQRRLAYAGLLALAALAFVLRLPGLDPPSLYLDDVWVGILARDASLATLLDIRPHHPIGFLAVESWCRRLLGSPGLSVQLLPFVASILLVPVSGSVALRLGAGLGGALSAGTLVAVSPTLGDLSIRAKPYATDALLTVLLLGAALRSLEKPGARRLLGLALLCGAAALVSYPCILVGGVAFATAFVPAMRVPAERARTLAVASGTALFFLAVYLVLLRGQANAALADWWRPGFASGSASSVLRFVATRAVLLPVTAFPEGWRLLALFLPAGLALLLARGASRSQGVLLLGVYAAAFASAAAGLFPLDPRTSAFTYPVTTLVAVVGIQRLLAGSRRLADGLLLFLAVSIAATSASPVTYPFLEDAALARAIHRLARPGDGILVYPHSSWTFAYYGGFPSAFEKSDAWATRFVMRPLAPGAFLLPGVRDFEDHPELLDPALREFLRRADRRVLYFATHLETRGAAPHARIQQALLSVGYRRRSIGRGNGSELLLFTR